MKRILNFSGIGMMLAAIFLLGSTDTFAQKRKPVLRSKVTQRKTPPAPSLYSVAAGTVIRARMNKTISSKNSRVGETFVVTVTEPVYSRNGVVVIPVGSTLAGRINTVKAAANNGKPGEIDASFNHLRLPNGTRRAINGSLSDLDSSSMSDNEGSVAGRPMKNRKLIFIGGGGVGGTILGGAIGGGKGALIGGLLGAGGGYLGERMTKGPEAEVRSGSEFSVYLNQTITLPRFTEGPTSNL